jgi:hypothetical protein
MSRRTAPKIATLLAGLLSSTSLFAIEEPAYRVVLEDGAFELRDYATQIVAETVVEGPMEDASSRAFRTLFRYIDGANTTRDKIEMTAPVTQAKRSQKIAMTAPVGQQAAPAGGWAVTFAMPAEYTMDTLPRPTDPKVRIREIPAYRAAVIRYSGTWSESKFRKHLAELEDWMASQRFEAAGGPVWARYNAPFTPWFLRRNEILIPVR